VHGRDEKSDGPSGQSGKRVDLSDYPPSHSLRNRLARCLWSVVYWSLFRFSPRPFLRWRALLLKLFRTRGCRFGAHRTARIWAPWNLVIGDHSMIDEDVDIYNAAPIRIGDRTIISRKTFLCTASHDYTDPHMPLTSAPIEIGNDVWIAADVFVAPGVRIGSGSVVGARSTVTRDLPEWQVCVGTPCVPVKERKLQNCRCRDPKITRSPKWIRDRGDCPTSSV